MNAKYEYKHLQLYGEEITGDLGGRIIKIEKVADTPEHMTSNIYDVFLEIDKQQTNERK